MKKPNFPELYFPNIISPKRIFAARKNLSWFKMVFCFILLNAILLIPISLHQAKQNDFEILKWTSGLDSLATNEAASQFNGLQIADGKLVSGSEMVFQDTGGVSGVFIPQKSFDASKNAISFDEKRLRVKDASGYSFSLAYPDSAVVTDLEEFINTTWYAQYKPVVFLGMVFVLGTLTLVSSLMLVLFSSICLALTKKSSFSKINSFKEAMNLTLNATGLPTIIAAVLGLIYFDITVMIGIQSLGAVLLIAMTFLKTRFYKEDVRLV
jgi:maltodextrin utilization protein YvdJ